MNRKALLPVLAVFLLGIAVGAMSYYVASTRAWADRRTSPVERLANELSLNADQRQKLSVILEEGKKQYQELYRPLRPQADAIRLDGRQRIRAILSAEQLPRFEEYLRKIDEERARRERGGK
jgi:uncharacterized membrane protein